MNKLSGAAFRAEVRQLQKQVSRLSAELEEEQQRWEWQHQREQVLLDLAAHQELILSTLNRVNAFGKNYTPGNTQLHGLGDSAAAPHQLLLPTLARATGASGSGSGSGSSSGSRPLWSNPAPPEATGISSSSANNSNNGPYPASYVADMLRSITPAQADNMRHLTPDQCRQRFSSISSHLVVLTEMVSRQQQQQQQEQQDLADTAPSANAAAAAATVATEPQSTAGARVDSATTAAAAAVTAAASAAAGIPPARASSSRSTSKTSTSQTSKNPADLYGKDPEKDMQALEQLVDELVCFSVLGLVYNWLPFYHTAIVQHIANGLAPTGHYSKVAKRLQLSDQQVLHLKIAVSEYNRLSKSARAAAADLLTESSSLMEALSLYVAAEEKIVRDSAASAGTAPGPMIGARITAAGAAAAAAAADHRLLGSSAVSNVLQISDRPGSNVSGLNSSSSASAPNVTTYQMYAAANDAAAGGGGGGGGDSSGAAFGRAGAAVADDRSSRPQQQQQQQQQQDVRNSKTLETVAQQHLLRLHLTIQMVCLFVFNTLTRLQIAELLVSSWPVLPILPAVAEAAADMYKDLPLQQQQQQQHDPSSGCRLGQLLNVAIHQHQQQRTASLRQQQMQWQREQQQLLQQVTAVTPAAAAAAAASGGQSAQ